MLPVYKIWHTLLSTRILLSKLLLSFLKRTYVSRNALNLNLLNYNMKILQVAFLLLFNYLDSLPKLYLWQVCNKAVKWTTPGVCLRFMWRMVPQVLRGELWTLQFTVDYKMSHGTVANVAYQTFLRHFSTPYAFIASHYFFYYFQCNISIYHFALHSRNFDDFKI